MSRLGAALAHDFAPPHADEARRSYDLAPSDDPSPLGIRAAMSSLMVVIATHQRPALLERTLDSLARAQPPPIRWDVAVVENGPPAGAEEVVRRLESRLPIRYLYLAEASKARALNLALTTCQSELVAFTDDDVRVAPCWLAAYAEAATHPGQGHFFGGPNDPDYERRPPAWLLPHLPPSAAGLSYGPAPRCLAPHEILLGGNWAAWRSDLLAAGCFDPALGPGPADPLVAEETALQTELVRRGVRGYWLPAALVHHWVPADRCSEEWALDRAVRHAMTQAWRESESGSLPGPRVFGVPRWCWRQLVEAWVARTRLSLSRAPTPVRFGAAMRLAQVWGTVRGVHRWDEAQRA